MFICGIHPFTFLLTSSTKWWTKLWFILFCAPLEGGETFTRTIGIRLWPSHVRMVPWWCWSCLASTEYTFLLKTKVRTRTISVKRNTIRELGIYRISINTWKPSAKWWDIVSICSSLIQCWWCRYNDIVILRPIGKLDQLLLKVKVQARLRNIVSDIHNHARQECTLEKKWKIDFHLDFSPP